MQKYWFDANNYYYNRITCVMILCENEFRKCYGSLMSLSFLGYHATHFSYSYTFLYDESVLLNFTAI